MPIYCSMKNMHMLHLKAFEATSFVNYLSKCTELPPISALAVDSFRFIPRDKFLERTSTLGFS